MLYNDGIMSEKMHGVQVSIVTTLRAATRARYSELLRVSGVEGDRFKYHLKALVKAALVQKDIDGLYILTASGKEFTNRLDKQTGREIAGPKASMLLVVQSVHAGETFYLAHQRQREPFYGFWGIASAPIVRGVPLDDAAARAICHQTGLQAAFDCRGMCRVIDRTANGTVLEDKLFAVMVATVANRPSPQAWVGGTSMWLTRQALVKRSPLFPTTTTALAMVTSGLSYTEAVYVYDVDDY